MTKPQPNKRAAEPIKVASKAPAPKLINRKAINIAASSEEQKYEAIARTLTRPEIGAARIGSRFVRFGFKGCPDVLGQLKDGRLLGVEVKTKTRKLRPEQKLCSWSASVALVAWRSLPATCATCCASWARYDVPELHSPPAPAPARDAVGLLADDRLPHETGHPLQMRALPRPAAGLIQQRENTP